MSERITISRQEAIDLAYVRARNAAIKIGEASDYVTIATVLEPFVTERAMEIADDDEADAHHEQQSF